MIAVDNDVLLKGSCFDLLKEIINAIPAEFHEIGVLQAAKFVIANKLRKANLNDTLIKFEKIIQQVQCLEPSEDEAKFAAQLEYDALKAKLNVDSGESLLCAIVIMRAFTLMVTGDKRAIKSLELLVKTSSEAIKLAGKIVCLEQLILRITQKSDARIVKRAICGRPDIDKTLTICFSCASPEIGPESWLECLTSYIRDIRSSAPIILTT